MDKLSTIGEIAKITDAMTNVKQGDDEPLLDYLEWFKMIYDKIEGLSQNTIITYFEGCLKLHALKTKFGFRRVKTLGKMLKTMKHVALGIEQSDLSVVNVNKTGNLKFESQSETPKQFTNKDKITFSGLNKNNSNDKGKNWTSKIENPFGLNIPVKNIIPVLNEKYGVRDPIPLNAHSNSLIRSKYYHFHKKFSHNMDDYHFYDVI